MINLKQLDHSFLNLVNGEWGEWLAWSTCSRSCEIGSKIRSRFCDNPAPTNNGSECSGISFETSSCNLGECPSKCQSNFLAISFYSIIKIF